jgi:hypothetical protein
MSLLIQNKDGILYAVVVERWIYVERDRAWNWQFHSIDHTSAKDQGEARFAVMSKYSSQYYRIVSVAPVIGTFGTEKHGIRI